MGGQALEYDIHCFIERARRCESGRLYIIHWRSVRLRLKLLLMMISRKAPAAQIATARDAYIAAANDASAQLEELMKDENFRHPTP